MPRIGRTGRNGSRGEALSLVSPDEGGLLRQIQRLLKADIAMEAIAGFEPSRPVRADSSAAMPKRGGGPRPQRAGRHHAPAGQRHAHAGPKQHRSGGQGRPASRRDGRG